MRKILFLSFVLTLLSFINQEAMRRFPLPKETFLNRKPVETKIVSKSGKVYFDSGLNKLHLSVINKTSLDNLRYIFKSEKCPLAATKKMGFNIIHLACLSGNSDKLEVILDELKKSILNFWTKQVSISTETALKTATESMAGIVNMRFKTKDTAMHLAVESNYLEAVKLLISHGANVNIKGAQGRTPIFKATKNKNTDLQITNLLIKNKAKLDEEDVLGNNPTDFVDLDSSKCQSLFEFATLKSDDPMTDECPICFDDGNREDFVMLPCGHVYHDDCIDEWLKQKGGNAAPCPQCKKEFKKEEIIK